MQAEATKLRGTWRSQELGCERFIVCVGCERGFTIVSGFLRRLESSKCDEGFLTGQRTTIGLLRQLRRKIPFMGKRCIIQLTS